MKNSIFALILSVCISAPAFSKTLYSNADSTVCLEINGKLLNNCINKYYKVELISCNTLLESCWKKYSSTLSWPQILSCVY